MFKKELKEASKAINIILSEEQLEAFEVYYESVIVKNKVMNLTAITETKAFVLKHIIDSLFAYEEKLFKKDAVVMDLGTGLGVPGIPLKILRNDLKIIFFDSLKKRLNFLEEVCQTLKLEKVEFLHGRAEDFAREPQYREKIDIVLARAVARLNILSELALPYVKVGGYFIALKGADYEQEKAEALGAIKILGAQEILLKEVKLPEIGDKRALLYFKKTSNCPLKYPRKMALIKKEKL